MDHDAGSAAGSTRRVAPVWSYASGDRCRVPSGAQDAEAATTGLLILGLPIVAITIWAVVYSSG